ncbi:MAG TPA: hypothetical protein VGQ84_02500 [Gaiellaceae bacterium]|jgi:hypothetical protein|nr:hypothetical protein [Gaiellaceae bacterium]
MRHRVATITLAAALLIATACGAAQQSASVSPEIEGELERIARVEKGPIYYLGRSFAGLPLRRAEVSERGALFIYGECRGEGTGESFQCTGPQIQLQQTPIASPARYNTPWRGCLRTTIRGVPAAQFDGFEVYTGDVLVKIYANTFRQSKAAALALRPVGRDDSLQPLPSPAIEVEQPLRQCALESLDAKLAELRRESQGTLYWVGREFENHPLARAEGGGRWARFSYGACVQPVQTDAGCWPPLTVEISPLAQFRPSGWNAAIACTALRVRGAWAADVPRANELVLFTGAHSVRLQGANHDLRRRAADALRPFDQQAAETLPAPPGTLEQELRRVCSG